MTEVSIHIFLRALSFAGCCLFGKDCCLAKIANAMQTQEQVRQLEVRRALDAEGWLSDVTILRKQLAAVDRKLHQMRLMDRLQVLSCELVLNCLVAYTCTFACHIFAQA